MAVPTSPASIRRASSGTKTSRTGLPACPLPQSALHWWGMLQLAIRARLGRTGLPLSQASGSRRPCYPENLPMRNVVIIGSGCAGNTAAIYAARAELKPLVVSGKHAGGQLSLTTLVENFPGFPDGIDGPVLVENMRLQAQQFGAEYLHGDVLDTDLSQRPFRLNVEGEWIESRTLIVDRKS